MRLSEDCVLVVVDIQEAFREVIPDFEKIVKRTSIAVKAFQILNLPVIVTEQYPKGLGKTAAEIHAELPPEFPYIEKTTFSSYREPTFLAALRNTGAKQVVVCGIEAHICVNQTVCDMLADGIEVHILLDCIASRTTIDRKAGIEKMTNLGANHSTVEMALFEIMEDSRHPAFREIQKLIK